MARKMNARTLGLRNFVEKALAKVREGDMQGAELVLVDLWNDVGCAYVCVQRKPEEPSLPTYNPKKDGDYSMWLVRNNMD